MRGFVVLSAYTHDLRTANVKEVAGQDQTIYEIVGKPYGLGVLVQAVKDAVERRPRVHL